MSYFTKFPDTVYDVTQPGETTTRVTILKDIIRRVKLKDGLVNNAFAYDEYDILEGERPDIVAHQFFNDSKLAWVILVTNEIHDVYEEWPRTERELNAMILKKYSNPDAVHHYERPQPSGDPNIMIRTPEATYGELQTDGTYLTKNSTTITNRIYEQNKNEEKRRIKILRRELLQDFIEEFGTLIGD